jgi:hypothetical protein
MKTTLASYLATLERIGWLDAVGPEECARLRAGLARHFGPRTNPFTKESFPAREEALVIELYRSLAPISFDAEDAFSDLAARIADFACGSHGRFVPEDIVVAASDEESLHVSFVHGGRRFDWSTDQQDWCDDGLLVVLNRALEVAGVSDRFHLLPALDQWLHFVLVPDAIFERARSEGVFGSNED